MINFNIPPKTGYELEHIKQAILNAKISGDGEFTQRCHKWLKNKTGAPCVLLTTSCTHALEMTAMLTKIKEGDEVIMPSYTFVSTANAFVLKGAKIIFVDIRPDTMNIDENLIEEAITKKTKAIVVTHYAGVACEMDKIMGVANRHKLLVIEDAAQGVMSSYKGRALGSIGDMGCYSFHETKNYSMGEGGAIIINQKKYLEKAEIIREKGTDRSRFLRGQIDKYSWVDMGSSYLPSELNAAYLYPQLLEAEKINESRLKSWQNYYKGLSPLADKKQLELPVIPTECRHNAHMFYIKLKNIDERDAMIRHLKDQGIATVFHYIPLHSSVAGRKHGRFHGKDIYTTIKLL